MCSNFEKLNFFDNCLSKNNIKNEKKDCIENENKRLSNDEALQTMKNMKTMCVYTEDCKRRGYVFEGTRGFCLHFHLKHKNVIIIYF